MTPNRNWKSRLVGPLRDRLTKVRMARPYRVEVVAEARRFEGAIAVVTGASGTIGRAIALRLAAEGAEVFAVGRDLDRLNSVLAEIRAFGGVGHATVVDLAQDDQIKSFFDGLNRVDILVNCAGGSARDSHGPIWSQTMAVVDSVLASNLRAAIGCTMAASAKMIEQRSGRIVNVGSVLGAHGKANFADYGASKAGLVGYTKSAAIELGRHGVTINTVSPGIVQRGEPTLRQLDRVGATNVLDRPGTAEDIAEAVAFFASSAADFITGQDLAVDGGRSLGLRGDA
ncbi:SDR family oxidoreductase [Microbacterium trichothecenolyticum]|uniref:SDR family NAD(P)-dependent oxidoreductase n=1 Tax=Microbacterium trichothecenolyticum TaxID=69370 RepID=UPI001C6E058B|nr:SDR family oxidoreductase [Microbacterium trichothecenolyticum]MBW9122398.1 SDR family oxidoreductase [Microbacterium trichothecenolyticum]